MRPCDRRESWGAIQKQKKPVAKFDRPLVNVNGIFAESLISKRCLFLGDAVALFRVFGVDLDVLLPLFGHIVLVENRFDWALRHASFAVDTFFWVYIKHLVPFVETLYGANHYAIRVLATRARFCNHVRHRLNLFSRRLTDGEK